MLIKHFVLNGADTIIAKAINDVMVLFGITENKINCRQEDGASTWLPADTVLVKSKIDSQEPIQVNTEFIYRLDDGSMKCLKQVNHVTSECEPPVSAYKRLTKLNTLAAMCQITGQDPGPWGILHGVRPTKLVHRLLDQGLSQNDSKAMISNQYAVAGTKAKLVTDIAIRQRLFFALNRSAPKAVSIYVGIPFCPSRCLYCSFPAYVLPNDDRIDVFLTALRKDIEAACNLIRRYNLTVENIYIGGGTPTSLSNKHFKGLLSSVSDHFITSSTREFTVEAGRPDSINEEKIDTMRAYNVSRVSINPQSMQQKTLNLIGRNHTVEDIINTFGKIRQSGIPLINMDVIAGLPGEDVQDVADTMAQIKALNPDNLTVHTLAVKKGSILKTEIAHYLKPTSLQGENIQHMLDIAEQYACQMNMHPYYLYRQKYMMGNLENVGYAKAGAECRYNVQIMEERQTIIGIGPAAATKAVNVSNWRLKSCYNAKDLLSYIHNVDVYTGRRDQLLAALFARNEEEY
ncbi:Oxygen-independent coproporphyrinogen-III oxidase-like protein HemZ [bioreactor metagenome]|uniref:Oxygen-independent coproporphyrinogen-III oxidase-like protein HemZ n=1 Tax=bioreactor metagenome TaxID=1076179 RepID=A0A644UZE7_9ZZZZ|nr:coproporphyrinogen dehydrogenase HemZ [Negativicutes bacterium]